MSENDPKMEINVVIERHEGVEENVDAHDSSMFPRRAECTDSQGATRGLCHPKKPGGRCRRLDILIRRSTRAGLKARQGVGFLCPPRRCSSRCMSALQR